MAYSTGDGGMQRQWTEELSVGVDEIDDQHKEMFHTLSSLFAAMAAGRAAMEAGKVIDFLGWYAVNHFQTEEKYMDEYRYPDVEAHKKEHEEFRARFSVYKNELDERGISSTLVMHLLKEISDWLADHIGVTDIKLGKFLISVMPRKTAVAK